jgi:hypothetical protein
VVALILALGSVTPTTHAQETGDQSTGDQAEAEAASGEPTGDEDKEEKKGPSIIPIPIFITEPAVGYGIGAAVGYFHKKKDDDGEGGQLSPALTADTAAKAGKRQKVPPTISGIAAAGTENGTWGVGIAHSASWKKDRIRYTGLLGYVHLVSSFYFLNQPFDFKLDTALLYQDIKFRIKSTDIFVGGKLVYLAPELLFDEDTGDVPEVDDKIELNDFGLALQADYDGRDNKMTPNRGQLVELVMWKHFEALGGDTDYWKVGFVADSFHEFMNQKLVLGLHLDLDTAGGDVPLWGFPYISMRGIPALRYQNESVGVLSTELRWNLAERWAALGFVGVGASRGDIPVFEDESGIVAGGLGGRFLFRPQDSLWVGLDVAKGPEQYVLYVVVGHKW